MTSPFPSLPPQPPPSLRDLPPELLEHIVRTGRLSGRDVARLSACSAWLRQLYPRLIRAVTQPGLLRIWPDGRLQTLSPATGCYACAASPPPQRMLRIYATLGPGCQPVATVVGAARFTFSPASDHRLLVVTTEDRSCFDYHVQIMQLAPELHSIPLVHGLPEITWSADGMRCVRPYRVVDGGDDPDVEGQYLAIYARDHGEDQPPLARLRLPQTSARFHSLWWSPSGKHIMLRLDDGSVVVWNSKGERQCRIPGMIESYFGERGQRVFWSWTNDTEQMETYTDKYKYDLYDPLGNCYSGRFNSYRAGRPMPDQLAYAWSPSGSYIATYSGERGIVIWDSDSGQCVLGLTAKNLVCELDSRPLWSPDGHWLVVPTKGGLHLWATDSWLATTIQLSSEELELPIQLAWSADSNLLAFGLETNDAGVLAVDKADDGQPVIRRCCSLPDFLYVDHINRLLWHNGAVFQVNVVAHVLEHDMWSSTDGWRTARHGNQALDQLALNRMLNPEVRHAYELARGRLYLNNSVHANEDAWMLF